MQTCILPSGCYCHSLSLASVKSRLVLPFWYWLTRPTLLGSAMRDMTHTTRPHAACYTMLVSALRRQQTSAVGIIITIISAGRRRFSTTTVDRDKSVLLIWRIFHCPSIIIIIIRLFLTRRSIKHIRDEWADSCALKATRCFRTFINMPHFMSH